MREWKKEKNSKRVVWSYQCWLEWEQNLELLLVYCSTIFTTTLSYLEHKNCNIKGKSCPIWFLDCPFVANVHMISNRKTFILNPCQLSFKSEKVYFAQIYRPIFRQNKPNTVCAFSMTKNERFGLVFTKTWSINSGTCYTSIKQSNTQLQNVEKELQTFEFPAFCSTTWAILPTHKWRNYWIFKRVVIKMFKLVSLWSSKFEQKACVLSNVNSVKNNGLIWTIAIPFRKRNKKFSAISL